MTSHRITDTAYSAKETGDWRRPVVCEHCGEAMGMHYQYADGRIVCVEVTNYTPRDVAQVLCDNSPRCDDGGCAHTSSEGTT